MDAKTFAAAAGLIISLVFSSAADVCVRYDDITDDLLRLHILAQSDSEYDQSVKLLVRDALLERSEEIFGDSSSREDILEAARENLAYAEQTANAVLEENGCTYKAHCELAEMYFDKRVYGDITVPQGEYTALRVTLGSGNGHNWWCVIYPPLCLPCFTEDETDDISEEEKDILAEPEKYEVKLYIAELIKKYFGKNHDK